MAQENMVSFYQYWEAMRDALAEAFEASGERHEALLAAIALALDFQTWPYTGTTIGAGPRSGRGVNGRDGALPDEDLKTFQTVSSRYLGE